MADFVQTMKDWRRMCKHYSDESMKYGQACADMCPLGPNTACGDIGMATDMDIEVMAKEVSKWAAEHPEPVYPTWAEWLNNIGVIISDRPFPALNIPVCVYQAGTKMVKPIPADLAEKLGLQPKEGV